MKLYVARDGQTDGPFTESELRAFINSGLIARDALVCPEGEDRWRPFWPEPRSASNQTDEFGEEVFYRQGNVTITKSRFVVGQQTFAVRNITTVEAAEVKQGIGPVALLLLVLAILVSFIGLAAEVYFLVFVGLAMAVTAISVAAARKPLYAVALKTSGGDLRAITDANQALIRGIVAALNKAIVSR